MPKPLREPPPSSSVAHLFDVGAAARAVATVPVAARSEAGTAPEPRTDVPQKLAEPALPAAVHTHAIWGEQPNVKRDLVLTSSTDEILTRLVELYRRSTATKLTNSHVMRAVLKGIGHCMDTLEREAKRIGPQKLPANARNKQAERERFEALIADAFVSGVRAAAAFDRD